MGRSKTPDVIQGGNGKNGDGLGGEWEVVSEKEKSDTDSEKPEKSSGKLEAATREFQKTFDEGQKQISEEERLETMSKKLTPEGTKKPRNVGFQAKSVEATEVLNIPRKAKKYAKMSMEAMVRGYEKLTEEEGSHNVAAWHNAIRPAERVRFWSDPDTELKLAQGTNAKVFRMGVDWSRIFPIEPVDGVENAVNWMAVDRYRYIIQRVLDHDMKVMLTLFHHSLPQWAAAYGGWKDAKTIKYFLDFTRLVVDNYGDLVDYWITFNEPHVFAMLTYCAGAWPGGDPDMLEQVTSAMPRGVFKVVMKAMADAHLDAFDIIHKNSKTKKPTRVGISHHVSFMRPYGLFDTPLVMFSNWMTRFAYCDDVAHKCDFMGINYYGQEVVSAPGLKNVENDEYSESGRGVYPDGLYRMLLQFHERYKQHDMKFIITENGVSDATDYIRRPYIIEHLLAIRAAMDQVHLEFSQRSYGGLHLSFMFLSI
jgi:beta-glucosidase/6-phospho-beta-glucosidase/beta-galactosidase